VRAAERARALGDPNRIRILDALAHTELPVGRIAMALACESSTISKHLQVLFHAGLVVRRRVATSVIYSLSDAALANFVRYLASAHFARR
jgi:DNA-binding transcriptional ArsR family regulator